MALRRWLVLAVVGALLVTAGVGLYSVPAGLVAAGVQTIATAYAAAYVAAKLTTPSKK